MCEEGQDNFHRLINLFAEIGRETLSELLLSKIPNEDVKLFLSDNRDKIDNLLGEDRILPSHYEALLSETPDLSKFEISILVNLLCYVCPGVSRPAAGWDKIPPEPQDRSVGAYILQLKQARNELLAHRDNTDTETVFYKGLKAQIKDVLKSIAQTMGENVVTTVKKRVKEVEKSAVDASSDRQKTNLHMVLAWYRQDVERMCHLSKCLQWSSERHKLQVATGGQDEPDAVRRDGGSGQLCDDTVEADLKSLEQGISHIELEKNTRRLAGRQVVGGGKSEPPLQQVQQELQRCRQQVDDIRTGLEKLWNCLSKQDGHQSQATVESPHPPNVASGTHDPHKDTGLASGLQPPKAATAAQFSGQAPRAESVNAQAIPDTELKKYSRFIGMNWELMAVGFGYTQHQVDSLKQNYHQKTETRLFFMLKKWHDVVVQCGDNARFLLAACFAEDDNNEAAEAVIGPDKLAVLREDRGLQPSAKAAQAIQQISFDLEAPAGPPGTTGKPTRVNVGAPGAINLFSDSQLTVEGTLDIRSRGSSAGTRGLTNYTIPGADLRSGTVMNLGGPDSMNVFSSKVTAGGVVIGDGSQQQTWPKEFVRGEMGDSTDSATPKMPASFTGHELKKEFSDMLSQSQVTGLAQLMKSVCAIVCPGKGYGTAFRVGRNCLLTAYHVIRDIVKEKLSLSADCYVTFNEELLHLPTTTLTYQLSDIYIWDEKLDIAFLEIANADENLPAPLALSTEAIDGNVPHVSLIGFGNPDSEIKKHLDPGCPVIPQKSGIIQAAHVWLNTNSQKLKDKLQQGNKDPSTVDLGFVGYDSSHNMIINCYSEQGASGGPLIDYRNPNSMAVVGVLTHGLPVCFWDLPKHIQQCFPKNYRLEIGTRMTSIKETLLKTDQNFANQLFP